jgi:putative transposase
MAAAAAAHPEADRVELWFADEARVGQKGRVTRVWYERGVRPRGVRDLGFASAYLFGAVCPERDAGVALVLPEASTVAMNLMLAELAHGLPPATHAVVVLDQAGWHTGAALRVPPNLTLVPLPPYSPELNPIEKVWQYLRDRHLSHRLFHDIAMVVDACCAAWNRLRAEPGRIRSLTAFPWLPACVSSS